MHVKRIFTGSRAAQAGVVVVLAAAALVVTANPSFAVAGTLTLSAPAGPVGGGNTITATDNASVFTAASAVEFTGGSACAVTYVAPATPTWAVATPPALDVASAVLVPPANVNLIGSSKMSILVPAGLILPSVAAATAIYHVCVYAAATGGAALISGSGNYTVAAASTVTSMAPTSGPAQGGTAVTVKGTAFPATGISATIGGVALGSPTYVNATTFTATMPAHLAGGPYPLIVTTTAGSVVLPAAFTYTNGLQIVPSTASSTSTSPTNVDVQGYGFSALKFTTTSGVTPNDANSHVYLTKGAYDPKTTGGATPSKMVPQSTECVNVTTVSDTELVCSLYLAGNGVSSGANTRSLSGCTATTGAPTILVGTSATSTCVFSPDDQGMFITGAAGIPVNTTILTYTDPTHVTLSRATTAAVASTAALTLNSTMAITDGSITSGATTITSATLAASGPFNLGDNGKSVSGPGILPGTTITVSGSPLTATLSQAATATGTAQNLTFYMPIAVPDGPYTVTVVSNGTIGAQTGASYFQSIVNSGSTFTVADYMAN